MFCLKSFQRLCVTEKLVYVYSIYCKSNMPCWLVAAGCTGPGPRRQGAKELILARGARRESLLHASACLSQPWLQRRFAVCKAPKHPCDESLVVFFVVSQVSGGLLCGVTGACGLLCGVACR